MWLVSGALKVWKLNINSVGRGGGIPECPSLFMKYHTFSFSDTTCFTEHVWKVARYTSAGPMFFTEFENYVDGGVLANNPCDFGLTAIQNFFRTQEKKLKIALVVSVGSGVYPAEELGKVDAQEFFFFGKHWFNFKDTIKSRAMNLMSLLTNAVSQGLLVY